MSTFNSLKQDSISLDHLVQDTLYNIHDWILMQRKATYSVKGGWSGIPMFEEGSFGH